MSLQAKSDALKLRNKVAVVTGGSAGIGLGAAKAFAREGARVFITGRREDELKKAVNEIGHGAVGVRADASNLADIDRLYEEVGAKAGRIEILMLNAGFYEFAKVGEITEQHFDKIYNTNVKGLFFAFQKALPLLSKGASVIFTGSIASRFGMPEMSIYGSSKAAVRALARGMVADTRDRGIRVNVLTPGHTATPGLDGLIPRSVQTQLIQKIPVGRLAEPEDLARAAVFLASDDSAYITGIELDVDGGVAQI